MANAKYIQGRSFENELKRKLQRIGFPLVIRTAGSHSCVDVIAFGWSEVYMFQCKSTEKTVITDIVLQATLKNKLVKDLTLLPSRYIKILAFKAKGMAADEWMFYRWNNQEWKFIQNKLF